MNRLQFDLLSYDDKIQFLETYGALVAQRFQDWNCYELYQYGSFYVEQQVCMESGICRRCYSFEDMIYLEPYLATINISSLTLQL